MRAKQCLVIGLGRFGTAIATTLYELGNEVVVVDTDEEVISRVQHLVNHGVIADATDERALRSLGVENFDVVVVAMGTNIKSSILITLAVKKLGAKHVVSKATDGMAAQVLEKIGADEVIRPEHDMGVRTAQRLSDPGMGTQTSGDTRVRQK